MRHLNEKEKNKLMADAREKAKHLAPAFVVVPEGNPRFAEIADEYNLCQARAKELLTELLYTCLEPGGPVRVEFNGGGEAWSNMRAGPSPERFDIATNAFVDRYIHYITKIG